MTKHLLDDVSFFSEEVEHIGEPNLSERAQAAAATEKERRREALGPFPKLGEVVFMSEKTSPLGYVYMIGTLTKDADTRRLSLQLRGYDAETESWKPARLATHRAEDPRRLTLCDDGEATSITIGDDVCGDRWELLRNIPEWASEIWKDGLLVWTGDDLFPGRMP